MKRWISLKDYALDEMAIFVKNFFNASYLLLRVIAIGILAWFFCISIFFQLEIAYIAITPSIDNKEFLLFSIGFLLLSNFLSAWNRSPKPWESL